MSQTETPSEPLACPPTDDLDGDPLFLIYDVARLMRVDADKRARAQGMTRAQWVILLWLGRQPGLSQKELSEILDVEPISVARLIDRLQARDMVERRPDPHDRRVWRLHLRPAGTDVLGMIANQRAGMREMVCEGIPEPALHRLGELLRQMKTNLTAERRLCAKEVA